MKKLLAATFPQEYILYVEGEGAEVVPKLMNSFRFDHVFYTGSIAVGKAVYQMAAKDLVPVTLVCWPVSTSTVRKEIGSDSSTGS